MIYLSPFGEFLGTSDMCIHGWAVRAAVEPCKTGKAMNTNQLGPACQATPKGSPFKSAFGVRKLASFILDVLD